MGLTIREMQKESWQISEDHGWHEPTVIEGVLRDASLGERLALVHSEISEALEALREGQELVWKTEKGKPEGVGIELADAVIRIGDICQIIGVDLESAIAIKAAYNRTRPFRHGGKAL